jgi:hypothetical protein
MTKLQSSLDVVIEMWRDLGEFKRSSSKEVFKKQLCEEFVRRSGAASLDETLATTMMSLVPLLRQMPSRKRVAGSPKPRRTNSSYAGHKGTPADMVDKLNEEIHAGSPIRR